VSFAFVCMHACFSLHILLTTVSPFDTNREWISNELEQGKEEECH